MDNNKRRILLTAALPYANGAIHLGHMLEYIQTDVWARFQRAQGHECYFAWADDAVFAHGCDERIGRRHIRSTVSMPRRLKPRSRVSAVS